MTLYSKLPYKPPLYLCIKLVTYTTGSFLLYVEAKPRLSEANEKGLQR